MSQHRQSFTTEEMITRLREMDAQIIHGSDFFSQVADSLARLKEDKESMDWLCTCTAGEWESLNNDRLSQRAGKLRQLIKARRDK